jgi:hypothetical protein
MDRPTEKEIYDALIYLSIFKSRQSHELDLLIRRLAGAVPCDHCRGAKCEKCKWTGSAYLL